MKVLTTTGLTKLIELSKDTFLDKNNVIDVANALAPVAISGSYTDLINKPTIGTATLTIQKNGTTVNTFGANATSDVTANITVPTNAADVGAVAANTAITGATKTKITYDSKGLVTAGADLAESDIPSLHLSKISDVTATATELNYVDGVTSSIQTQLNTITGKIPSAATTSNQLADKAFVNSSINSVAAYYITSNVAGDAFATKAALIAGPYYHDGSTRTPTENDYAIVTADESKDNACTRYSYTGSQWSFQYIVNNTPFTQAQVDAINSGITSTKVSNYDTHIADTTIHVTSSDKTNWNNKVDKTSTASKLYATDSNGSQTTLTYSQVDVTSSATANAIVQRDANSQINVPQTPTANTHAASKKYVDDGLSTKQPVITGGATTIVSDNLTASCALVSDSNGKVGVSTTTSTELGYVHGVTSAIQTQLNSKQATITGAASTITSNNLTTSRALVSSSSGKVAVSTTTSTELGYVHGVTSAIQTQLNNKQATLVSGTNIKSVNGTTLLGSGDLSTYPTQSGNSGKFLTTNGTSVSWADVPEELPSQSGNSGKFLTTNGTAVSWASVDAFPSQSGNNGKFLTTNGSVVSWANVPEVLPSQSGQSGKYLTTDGTDASWANVPVYTNGAGISLSSNTFSADCDTTTVSTNSSNKLQAIGVVDKRASGAIYTWKGTLAQYNALTTKNDNWLYYITDEGTPSSDSYYTKAQIDAMMIANHTITQDTAKVILKDTNTNANAATTPSTNHNGGLVEFQDKNGVKSGYLYTAYKSNGNIEQVLESDRTISGTATSAAIKVGITSTGATYTEAPMPAASTSIADTNIATVGWINDPTKSTGLVHIAGTETITGAKTFSGNNTFSGTDTFSGSTQFTGNPAFIGGANDAFTVKNSLDDHMLAPAETLSTNIELKDANGNKVGGWEHYHQADGTCITQMVVREQGEENEAFVRVSIDGSGNARCDLPAETYGTNFHGISTRALWADLAEKYRSDKVYPIGTLIRFGGEKDITAATINCNGVISDKPGYVLDDELEDGQPVALVGKTPIRILGKVRKFDRIVLDLEHPGVGKVQTTSDEKVIGIALENNDNQLEKLVLCVTKFNLD